MEGFDYGNARLRAMKARLLDRQEFEVMAAARTIRNLIDLLIDTPYRRALESALIRATGREAIMQALHEDLVQTLGKVREFFSGKTRQFVDLALRGYDIHNVKTILRGLDTGVLVDEILQSTLSVGQLSPAILEELSEAASPREAIDRMGTMRLAVAQPLFALRAERPGAGIFAMEVVLEQWHHEDARSRLEKAAREFRYLSDALDVEADINNIMTVLRFARNPEASERLEDFIGTPEVSGLLVGPGKLPLGKLYAAANQDSVEQAVEILARMPYEYALRTGLEGFRRTARLSEIENQLRRFRVRWRSKLVLKDPLGIGVLLAYMALKTNEVQNIRSIALGIDIGLDSEAIIESLVLIG